MIDNPEVIINGTVTHVDVYGDNELECIAIMTEEGEFYIELNSDGELVINDA